MEDLILRTILPQGIFALLFLYLLFYVLKTNSQREGKYQDIISKLTDKFDKIESGLEYMGNDIKDIKDRIFK